MKTIPIFAHRGASSIFLENTFSAFKKAKDLGADSDACAYNHSDRQA